MSVPKEFAEKEIALLKELSKDGKSIHQIAIDVNESRCKLCKERHYGQCITLSESGVAYKLFKCSQITKKELDAFLTEVAQRKKEIRNEKRKGFDKKRVEKLHLGKVCEICGSTSKLEVHHIIPVFEKGTHDLENLMVLCGSCHKLLSKNRFYLIKSYLEWEKQITPQEMSIIQKYDNILKTEKNCKLIKVLDGSRQFFWIRVEKIHSDSKVSETATGAVNGNG